MSAETEHLNMPVGRYRLIGVAEVAGSGGLIAGIFMPGLGIAPAVCLTVLILGAAGTHVRLHDPAARVTVPAILALLTLAVILLRMLAR